MTFAAIAGLLRGKSLAIRLMIRLINDTYRA
jgi:hypothetical protein